MEKNELNNSTIIRNISDDESEILHDILELHTDGEETFDADFTASTLNFYKKRKGWKYVIPVPEHLYDVFPSKEGIEKITPFQKIPVEDGTFSSVCIDLPFVISPKTSPSMVNDTGASKIAKRFASWYPAKEGYYNMYWWIKEAYRTLKDGGILAYKMQNTTSGGLQHWFVHFAFMVAQSLGFYVIDEFTLQANNRLISAGKYKQQQHARKYTSTWLVMKKDSKRAVKCDCFSMLKECEGQELEGYEFEVK